MCSEADRLGPLRTAAAAILLVPLVSLGCGLKGDPLPPLRPPEPAEEEVPAGTEDAAEASAEGEDADSGADNDDGEDAEPEAEDNDGEDGEPEADNDRHGDGDGEEDGSGAKGPA